MLAYLFFHHLRSGTDSCDYEEGLRRFHAALAEAGVAGFAGSKSFHVGDEYCDWYLVESSAVLDALNDAAVSGARSAKHDAVAHHATDFAGKLLKLVDGMHDLEGGFEIRFSKPRGMSYPELYRSLKPFTDRPHTSLWRRMMVLGPPPEFCLLSRFETELAKEFEPQVLIRDPV